MNLSVEVKDLNHEDLVNLFSTSLYGNTWPCAYYRKEDYYGTELENANDCIEDKFAKLLLAGKSILIGDRYSEDKDDVNGTLPNHWSEDDEFVAYEVTLEDVKNGLNKAAQTEWGIDLVNHLTFMPEELDLCEADTLLQCIVFGEPVYG